MASSDTPTTDGEPVKNDQNDSYDKQCIFCKIVNGEMNTELLHSDEDTSCFRDIKPGAPHHYLVVPTKHSAVEQVSCVCICMRHYSYMSSLLEMATILPTKSYRSSKEGVMMDKNNVEKLVETGKAVLQKNNFSDLSDARLGFHLPPFQSVAHLHLHVLAPASQMGFMSRFIYRPDSYWFMTVDQLLQRLNSMG